MNLPKWVYSKQEDSSYMGTIVYNMEEYEAIKDVFNLDSTSGKGASFIHIDSIKSKLMEVPDAVQEEGKQEGREEEITAENTESNENENEIDIDSMDKEEIEKYIKENYGVDLDKRKKIENLRKEAKEIIEKA